MVKKVNIDQFYQRISEENPEPTSELEWKNPYQLIVAVALSAQATDVSVNKATAGLFQIVDTPEKMIKLGEKKLKKHIRTIGLYNTKAKNVIRLSQILINKHGSEIPQERKELEALPGVGRKTANVVLNVAFGQSTIAVDTHVYRVSNRTGLAPGKTPLEVETKLLKRTPDRWKAHAHHWLILHGRYVCKARKPNCSTCIVQEFCCFKGKELTQD